MKWYIRFRKKLILPFKWMMKEKKYANSVQLKEVSKILEAKKLMEADLITAQRIEQRGKMELLESQIELLNWILQTNDNPKD